ncbi:MAG: apolipoprotein N-acyltransferase [Saprospiraceae bacterium]|nr:apolipoprotein N-acyltransferase [Saprospiraceae bacterium]
MNTRLKVLVIIFLLAIVAWMSYELFVRAQEQLLWGYRPLWLFLAFWGIVMVLFYKPNRLLVWSSLSGVLLGLGFPGWLPIPFLMFGAFVPLLFVTKQLEANTEEPIRGRIFKYSFHTFILWNILSTYWIANSSLVAGVFAILANSALMSIPFVLAHQTRLAMARLGYAPLVAYWLVFEYLHYNWELNYPWLTLGNSFAQFPALVQWYEYSGVFGGSLWILIINIFILKFIESHQKKQNYRRNLVQIITFITLPVIISLYFYYTHKESDNNIDVVVVQPNYEPHHEESNVPEGMKLERCIELASPHLNENTDFLILPEAVFGYVEMQQMSGYPIFERLREWMKSYPRLHIISGMNVYRILQKEESSSSATRTDTSQSGEIIRYEMYNAAIQLSPNSQQVQLHKKSRLVPGPESFPFKRFLFFLEPVMERFGGTTAGLGTESSPVVFESESLSIAPLICYESVFGEYITRFVQKGASAIFIMTNDGWWDNTAGHRQHLYFASLRAIETRRSIARAANTGISAFINQRGDLLQKTDYDEPIAIRATLQLRQVPTFYIRWGDMIGRLSLFAAAIFILNTLVRSIVRKED